MTDREQQEAFEAELSLMTRGVRTEEQAREKLGERFYRHGGLDAALDLMDAGLISYNQMIEVLQWTDATQDTPELVIALVAGEFGISKARMREATNFSDDLIDRAGEQMKTNEEWIKDKIGATKGAAGGIMSAVNKGLGFIPGLPSAGARWGAGKLADWWEIDPQDEADVETLLAELDKIPDDQMTKSEKDGYRRRLEGTHFTGDFFADPGDVLNEVAFELRDFKEYFSKEGQNIVTPDEGFDATGPLPTPAPLKPADERLPGDPGYDYQMGGRDVVDPDDLVGIPGTYGEYVAQSGLVPLDEQNLPIDVPTLSAGIASPLVGQASGESWYDKATGQTVSTAQYKRILEGYVQTQLDWAAPPGGGAIGEFYDFYEEGPNLNDPRIRGAVGMFGAASGTGATNRWGMEPSGPGQTRQTGMGRTWSGTALPEYLQETLKVPSLLSVEEPWEKEAYHFQGGSAQGFLDTMSAGQRRLWINKLERNGLTGMYDTDGNPYVNASNQDWFILEMTESVLGVSNGKQVSPWEAVPILGQKVQYQQANRRAEIAHLKALADALTPKKEPFAIPRSLRSIPDIREITTSVKDTFKVKLGRDPTEGELVDIANDLQGYHRTSQAQQIDLAYAQWEGSDDPDDFDITEGIQNPGLVSQYDIENKWANEINLNARRETNGDSFNRIMSATGGNLGSAGRTPATGENIVRL